MLKPDKYIYEGDLYKIKNPTNLMIRKIQDELSKYSNDELDDIDFDNPKLNLWLLQYLVESDNVDYQFDKYGLGSFTELMNSEYYNPELETIFYHIGKLISDIIIKILRDNLLLLKEQEMKALQLETLEELDKVDDKIKLLKEEKKKRRRELELENHPKVEIKKLSKFQEWKINREMKKNGI